MWSTNVILLTVVTIACTETTVPGISRTFSQGVTSMGYKIIYGDEDITAFNEVVSDAEKNVLKPRQNAMYGIDPLKAEDVKCLMSVDRYCSDEMGEVKSESMFIYFKLKKKKIQLRSHLSCTHPEEYGRYICLTGLNNGYIK